MRSSWRPARSCPESDCLGAFVRFAPSVPPAPPLATPAWGADWLSGGCGMVRSTLTSARGRDSATPDIDPETKQMWRIAWSTGAIGFEIVVALALGYFGGGWLDGKLGTTPWLKYIGLAAGVGACIKAFIRVTREYKKSIVGQNEKPNSAAGTPDEGKPNEGKPNEGKLDEGTRDGG